LGFISKGMGSTFKGAEFPDGGQSKAPVGARHHRTLAPYARTDSRSPRSLGGKLIPRMTLSWIGRNVWKEANGFIPTRAMDQERDLDSNMVRLMVRKISTIG